jgi:hypothetical protein
MEGTGTLITTIRPGSRVEGIPRSSLLRRGTTGKSVRELQRSLLELGLLSNEALFDGGGVFGPRTEEAVRGFQRRHGLPVTGKAGSLTRRRIRHAADALHRLRLMEAGHLTPSQLEGHVPLEVKAALTSQPGARSASRYTQVLNQFQVGQNPRYQPREGRTMDALFVLDVARAMGSEIPPAAAGPLLSAQPLREWMNRFHIHTGWNRIDAETAQRLANAGHPVVAFMPNAQSAALVRPGFYDGRGPLLAYAGKKRFNEGRWEDGSAGASLEYWAHA